MDRCLFATLATLLLYVSNAQAGGSKPETDSFGDPLPQGAIRRIGTIRLRHSDTIRSVAYSRDGKFITSAADNGVAVWEAQTGRRVSLFSIPSHFHSVAAVSPDGLLFAYALEDNAVRVCETRSAMYAVRYPLKMEQSASWSSQDGSALAATEQNRRVFVWDTNNGELLQNGLLPRQRSMSAGFTGDSKTRACRRTRRHTGWDIKRGKELVRIGQEREIRAIRPGGVWRR